MSINDNISTIKGIGLKKTLAFEKLGVKTIYDLFCFFPRKYEDRTRFSPIASIKDGENVCIRAFIASNPSSVRIRKGMELVKFKIADDTGIADVTFFNMNYVKSFFEKGKNYAFYGKVEVVGKHISLTNPVFEMDDDNLEKTGVICPIYRLVHGLTQNDVIKSINSAFENYSSLIDDYIPDEISKAENLCSSSFAYRNIHQPKNFDALNQSRNRLVFEELFLLYISLLKNRNDNTKLGGIKMSVPDMTKFFSSLPFKPTNAQHKAISDAINDMISGKPMNRLIQGDVGSGKTLVAAALFYLVYKNGFSSVMMAPTEILASQHFDNLEHMLSKFGMKIALLTGASKNKEKIKTDLVNGNIDLLIGTHALISDDVKYNNLAFIVTDEQHRFGVNHRTKLISKVTSPHVCVMSATPIPRTLSLIIYGDLDVSVIDELPPGRTPVDTFLINETYRKRINNFILRTCESGNQVYIVCPKIEEDEGSNSSIKSAEQHCEYLRRELKQLRINCIHGRMSSNEKDAIMTSFSNGSIDVLVSTTVIEVGVDVPNATLMIVENAERFGLSQLHQLRGRVGRGSNKSYCILVSDTDNEETKNRLNVLCKTNDGFKISEEDLRIRGPGDFFGNRQHGLPQMHLAQLGTDSKILTKVQMYAKNLLDIDPKLEHHNLIREKTESILNNNVLLN